MVDGRVWIESRQFLQRRLVGGRSWRPRRQWNRHHVRHVETDHPLFGERRRNARIVMRIASRRGKIGVEGDAGVCHWGIVQSTIECSSVGSGLRHPEISSQLTFRTISLNLIPTSVMIRRRLLTNGWRVLERFC